MINKYILDIYIFNSWNLDCDSRVSGSFFFQNLHETQGSQSKFHELNIYTRIIE